MINLADVTPNTDPDTTRCTVCQFAATLNPANAATFGQWMQNVRTGQWRRSAVRDAIVRAGGPLLSETAFGRHVRNHA